MYRNNSHPEISNSSIKKGKVLANTYCSSCHALPDPAMLDFKTWEKGILPAMGPRLGIFSWNGKPYRSSRNDMSLDKNFYPDKPTIKPAEWQDIINYYIATSPDSIREADPGQKPIKNSLSLFAPETVPILSARPATTMVKIINHSSFTGIIASDAISNTLYRYDGKLSMIDSIKTRGPVVDIDVNAANWVVSDIGVLNPNNGRYGSVRALSVVSGDKIEQDSTVLFESLQRPVQITSADLNQDGRTDYLVCEFGYLTGALSWMESVGNGNLRRHVLRPLPGAIKAYLNDYNRDGLTDIWVLFAQGREGVFLYTNRGQGRFEEKEVIGFPAVNGSSYFELVDFNKDGTTDILYTCGDNADYSTILKPFHGVYLFLNDGKNNFRQSFFYHINGCFKAIARDYDNDNDYDIAAISFFADYRNKPEEGFVYLENFDNNIFTAYSLPETQKGRWLTMDAGDVDGDGKTDLVLGNFSVGPSLVKSRYDWKKGPSIMVLRNTGKASGK